MNTHLKNPSSAIAPLIFDNVVDNLPNTVSNDFINEPLIFNEIYSMSSTFAIEITETEKDATFLFDFEYKKRETFLITAFRNLLKKNDFLQLSSELSSDVISDEEFNEELERNPSKYIIDVQRMNDSYDLHIISDIIQKVGVEISIDEVAEIFSLEYQSVQLVLNKLLANK